MKKYIAFAMVLVVLLSFMGCNSQVNDDLNNDTSNNNTTQTEDNKIEIPDDFDVIPDENLSEIPEKYFLDDVIDEVLNSIGVASVKYKSYGNYDNIANISATIEIFMVTDTNKSLIVNMIFMSRSKEWDVMFISDTEDGKYYYIMPGADATEDIYDYKTGELLSKQSMTHEEYSEEIKKQEEEAEKKFQEELDRIVEDFKNGTGN